MIRNHIAAKKQKADQKKKDLAEGVTHVNRGGRHLAGRNQQTENSSDSDDESILQLDIPPELQLIVEDPVKDREYPVPFDSPDDLMNIFRELED